MAMFVPYARHTTWSRTRNIDTAVVAVIILALGIAASPVPAAARVQAEINAGAAGRWEGAIQIPGAEMVVVIDLAQNSKGDWAGSVIVPGHGIKGAPLADIAVKDSDVAFAIKGALSDPRFKGHINSMGSLVGNFEQAGNTAPFTLLRSGPPQVEPQPQSTRVSKNLEGEWQGEFELPGRKLHVHITLANQAGGMATAKFLVKGKRETDLPVDFVIEEDDLITINSPSMNVVYQGWFRKDTNEIKGTLQLGPTESPLVLHRAPKTETGTKP